MVYERCRVVVFVVRQGRLAVLEREFKPGWEAYRWARHQAATRHGATGEWIVLGYAAGWWWIDQANPPRPLSGPQFLGALPSTQFDLLPASGQGAGRTVVA